MTDILLSLVLRPSCRRGHAQAGVTATAFGVHCRVVQAGQNPLGPLLAHLSAVHSTGL